MAYVPISINTQDLLITDEIPDFVATINSNTSLLKGNIEDLINDLQIDPASGKIGLTDPIGQVYSTRMQVLADNVANDGYYMVETDGLNLTDIAHIKRVTLPDATEGSEVMADRLVINSSVDMSAADVKVGDFVASGDSEFDGPAVFDSVLDMQSGVKESLDYDYVVDFSLSGVDAIGDIDLTNITKKNIFVALKMDITVYDPTVSPSGWDAGLTGYIKIVLNKAATVPSETGSSFNIILGRIIDQADDAITDALTVDVMVVPGVDKSNGSASISFTDPVTTYFTMASAGASNPICTKTMPILQVIDGTDVKFHVIK